MLQPVGPRPALRPRTPTGVFDVGIAEQHAATSAAGLALGGLHPVVAVYATFLNRAFDQVLLDVALHRLPVTFVLDRAGITGPDGPATTACGTCRSSAGAGPADRRAARRATLREELREALAIARRADRRAVPQGLGAARTCPRSTGSAAWTSSRREGDPDVLLVGFGALAATCARGRRAGAAPRASASPSSTRAGSSRSTRRCPASPPATSWSSPSRTTAAPAAAARLSPSCCATPAVDVPLCDFALPQQFLPHGRRDEMLAEAGLSAQQLARRVIEAVARREPGLVAQPDSVLEVDSDVDRDAPDVR